MFATAYHGLQGVTRACQVDSYFGYTVLLVHFDGAEGSQSAPDLSTYQRTTTVTGAANMTSAVRKFGNSSIYLSSTGFGAYGVSWANSSDFNIATGDFTIEMWAYELGGSLSSLIARRPGGTAHGWAFTTSAFRAVVNGVYSDTQMTWTKPSGNAWHHYALVRSGSTLRVYVDGTSVASLAGVSTLEDSAVNLCLGQSDNASENKFLGYIDELRFTRGVARYTSNFTPASLVFCDLLNNGQGQCALDAYFANTILSMHGTGYDGSTIIKDVSPKLRALTAVNGAQISATQTHFGGNAVYFDGDAYVSMLQSADFSFGTGDFTVEAFIYLDAASNTWPLRLLRYNNGTLNDFTFEVWCNSSPVLNFFGTSGGSTTAWACPGLAVGQWRHMAFTRQSGVMRAFMDGVQLSVSSGSANNATNITSSSGVLSVAAGTTSSYLSMVGRVQELRVTTVCRYSAAFTPPSLSFCNYTDGVSGGGIPNSPAPPGDTPITFSAITESAYTATVGSSVGTVTLATVTCADAAMTIRQNYTIPGLTLGYASNVLTMTGTPTAPGGVYRLVVSYIASDGTNVVRGSTTHTITVNEAAGQLTIGTMANPNGQVGVTFASTLATPSMAVARAVYAISDTYIGGLNFALNWPAITGSTTPPVSGPLVLTGVPNTAGTYTAHVKYWDQSFTTLFGTSTHIITIYPAYAQVPAPPAPSPDPGASPPASPSPPAPAPAPGAGADALVASVKLLARYDTDTISGAGFTSAIGAAFFVAPLFLSGTPTTSTGVVNQGATVVGGSTWLAATGVAGMSGADGNLSAECFVQMDSATWTALDAAGGDFRYCPVLTYVDGSNGSTIWTMGFASVPGSGGARTVFPLCAVVLTSGYYQQTSVLSASIAGPTIPFQPTRLIHLCYERVQVSSSFRHAVWFDGSSGAANDTEALSKLKTATSGTVNVGGAISAFTMPFLGTPNLINFGGVVDELRLTAAARRGALVDNGSGVPQSVPAYLRTPPWPDY